MGSSARFTFNPFSASVSLASALNISRWSETDISVEVTTAFLAGESLVFDNNLGMIQGLAVAEGEAETDLLAMSSAIAQTVSAATPTSADWLI